MKNIISLFVILMFFVSCSSTNRKKEVTTVPEIDKISNDDLLIPVEIPFDPKLDKLDSPKKQLIGLNAESLDRYEGEFDLYNLESDPISYAISMCYKKNFSDAFEMLDNNYQRYRKHPSFWNQVATCYYLKGEKYKAVLYYNKAIEVNKNYAPPFNNLGVLYIKEGKDQKALVAFQKAAKLSRYATTPLFNVAQVYLKYGIIKKANKIFKDLYQRDTTDRDVISGLANSYVFLNEMSKAEKLFNSIEDEYLWRPDISLNYAVALGVLGKKGAARDVLSRVDQSKLGNQVKFYEQIARYIGYDL